jgi:hypothetical protein
LFTDSKPLGKIASTNVVAKIEKIREGKRSVAADGSNSCNPDSAACVPERKLPQKDCVHRAEDRRICAYAQREREHAE